MVVTTTSSVHHFPFPTLSLFSIYSTTPLLPTPPADDDGGNGPDDATIESAKLLFFFSSDDADEQLTKERKARLMGTVMGMADFARMLSTNGGPAVRSVHSQRKRMLWYQAEAGIFVHATIDIPQPTRHDRAGSNATITALSTTSSASTPVRVNDEALLTSLELGYREYRLLNSSIRGRLGNQNEGKEELMETLEEFWSKWVTEWNVSGHLAGAVERVIGGLPRSPLSTPSSQQSLAPLLSQFSASNSHSLPILLHRSQILYLPRLQPPDRPSRAPPPPPLTETDLMSTLHYLTKLFPPPPIALLPPMSKRKSKSKSAVPKKGDPVPQIPPPVPLPAWMDLGNLSRYSMPMTMPSFSVPSMGNVWGGNSSASGSDSETRKGKEKEKDTSMWGIKGVKWSTLSKSGIRLLGISTDGSSKVASELASTIPLPGSDSEVEAELNQMTEALSPPETPVKVQVEVNAEDLAEAMGEQIEVPKGAEGDPKHHLEGVVQPGSEMANLSEGNSHGSGAVSIAATSEVGSVEVEAGVEAKVIKAYCGGDDESRDTPFEIRIFIRGDFILALASLPFGQDDTTRTNLLTSRSRRLLEAVETVLDPVVPFETPYPHRHLVKVGHETSSKNWPKEDGYWSGKSSVADAELEASLMNAVRSINSSDPAILETFVRTNSSHWVVGKQSQPYSHAASSTPKSKMEVYLVLPPKSDQEGGTLVAAGEEISKLENWGAGGATSEATTAFVKAAHAQLGLETCMHLTCTNMPVEMIDSALKEAFDSGCQNILALRGDPPRGSEEWVATEGGFNHAIDLIRHIRKNYGDYFDIGIAGFPEGHPQSESADSEMKYLREKVDAGANLIFTQMFYDADVFINWATQVRNAGITIPIVPGIMPIQTFASFKRRTAFSKTIVPPLLMELLEPIQDDDKLVRELGTKFVGDMVRKILNADLNIHGIHCYTMNLSRGTEMLLEELGFVASADIVKPLPWRLSLTSKRRTETTRPIFWSNRQRSYLSRTADWDEFPNGRWGDQASPAFGDLDALSLSLPVASKDATQLWGSPTTLAEISTLFARFCRGDLASLPWSDQPTAKETSIISEPLARINELGFLTINSQPRVDGAKSSDAAFGWGPRNGYVYQKAYLEFFAPPDRFEGLLELLDATPSITYHAVNKQGELRTNTVSGPNAVTWGVFPGAEVIQPTVVDAMAFTAWKDEAFELGAQWATLYDKTSEKTASLIRGIMDSYYLVNIVYNDYRDPNDLAIFEPFFALGAINGTLKSNGTSTPKANGLVHAEDH